MAEPQAIPADQTSPEIGDVLASIRRLIAQEDILPGYPRLMRQIESKLSQTAMSGSPDRVEMGETPASAGDRDAPMLLNGGSLAAVQEHDDKVPDIAPEGRTFMTGAGPGDADLPPCADESTDGAPSISTIIPHQSATTQPETHEMETGMMLAEIARENANQPAQKPQAEEGFDLFAADNSDQVDHLSGGNALRNLVRDVIRQELQGEMGERISRNLRRAIRQEVTSSIEAGLRTS
ncbi:hypothetical protein [Paracoccus aerodenitrificans]|uniref:hypothetical protein n=1 Tax=Paracoccus aerodenitrificans TaxID=3017781 RepID=UPI0022F11489|nr:hypothetical protein [Paracoccus aerodenitrificans]WBU65087.1 hypothetical protein PAE61_06565 [Paracoccus aerodenitrificans]